MKTSHTAKRLIARIYSAAADTLYEPVVINGSFRLFGGRLNDLILGQGQNAVVVAGAMPLLDVPVGTAHFTVATARRHRGIVVGADLARGMTLAASRSARSAGLGNLVVVQADLHDLPFPDGSFGAVMCSNGLQVIPDHRRAARELARVLAPGRTLFVSVVTLPLGGLLPPLASIHLPALFSAAGGFIDAFTDAGLSVTSVRRERLALLLEAVKPA
ncbi:MAG: class I SAM-dependent methyltransferase [Actinobacteria bacterium]|nr:class I SAM-dependent methyltransferase [Actinomycetota bacterium]